MGEILFSQFILTITLLDTPRFRINVPLKIYSLFFKPERCKKDQIPENSNEKLFLFLFSHLLKHIFRNPSYNFIMSACIIIFVTVSSCLVHTVLIVKNSLLISATSSSKKIEETVVTTAAEAFKNTVTLIKVKV